MQSFTMNESFPMNAWYAAAWDVELKNDLLPRTICNKPLVLYRKKDGTLKAYLRYLFKITVFKG
jgi:vanillate O-demethylase monooxygenase subunit